MHNRGMWCAIIPLLPVAGWKEIQTGKPCWGIAYYRYYLDGEVQACSLNVRGVVGSGKLSTENGGGPLLDDLRKNSFPIRLMPDKPDIMPVADAAVEAVAHARAVFQTLDRTVRFPYSKREYIRRFAWLGVQATVYHFSPGRAYGWRRWLLRCFGAKMGISAAVHGSTRIIHPWLLELGDWSNLAGGVTVYNLGPVRIGNHTLVSQDAYLCAGSHDYTEPTLPLIKPPIVIGNGVWVCAGAFIGPGVTIGDNSVIGARAVVAKDIPGGVVAAGNPCRVIKVRAPDVHLGPGEE